jgi:hypothetical protein
MSAADLVRAYGLKPDDLVVHAGAGGVEVLRELREYGCRVLRLDPDAVGWDGDIDTLRVARTPAVERLVRERYGPVSMLIVNGVVVERTRPIARAA